MKCFLGETESKAVMSHEKFVTNCTSINELNIVGWIENLHITKSVNSQDVLQDSKISAHYISSTFSNFSLTTSAKRQNLSFSPREQKSFIY